uniref:THAP domain-containing protein 1 n=1 Tax=Astatotilapia calliptera TaxID=8154 RepID=A0A3P8P437_ASTCA
MPPWHCCVPLCSASAKFNGILSFHAFPTHSDLRRQWLLNIRRDHFTITSHTRVCCRHFASDQLRTERRPEGVPPDDQEEHSLTRDHDYCSVPEPSALDISASAAEDLSKDVETLRKEIQELRVQREFGLQRFHTYTGVCMLDSVSFTYIHLCTTAPHCLPHGTVWYA